MGLLSASVSAGEYAGESCTVVALTGHADASVRGDLEDALMAEARKGPRRLVVELSGLESMDSVALLVIVWASRVLDYAGGVLMLVSPQPAVARLLEHSGIAPMLPVYGSVVDG
ncbi:MAG TPA: STAS domain-containing protein [Streptosporangiaceae bacterium]|nr:STAS domain-containing protein [Streptosporangiaceae bacterium]